MMDHISITGSHQINRRRFLQAGSIALGSGLLLFNPRSASSAEDLDPISYQTSWIAQGEHGGFYQAKAIGLYEEYGLDVKIQMGGPQVNGMQLLAGGATDCLMGSSSLGTMKANLEDIPVITVAAMFQKFPQTLVAHAGVGHEEPADLQGKPIMIATSARTTYWPFLKAKFGFTDDQARPYTYNYSQFLVDEQAVQQGYITDDEFQLQKEGVEPSIMLLADYGFNPYACTIDTTKDLVESDPERIQRFVDASIKGWYSYLYDDPTPGNQLIQQDNPDMGDDFLAWKLDKMRAMGIVDSGDAKELGIGAMTDQRWEQLYADMVEVGVMPEGFDVKRSYTLEFVNQQVGME